MKTLVSRLRLLGFCAVIGLVSLLVLGAFFRAGINGYPPAMLTDMIRGQAHRPFVTRALAPWLIRGTLQLMPKEMVQRLTHWAASASQGKALCQKLNLQPDQAAETLAMALVSYLALIVFAISLYWFLRALYEVTATQCGVAVVLALAALPCFFKYYSYLYDFPTLALFTLGLVFMVRQQWGCYLVSLALTTWSKETAILLPVIFSVHHRVAWRTPKFLWLLGVQLGLYALIRGWLCWLFKNQPGAAVEFHLGHNLFLPPYDLGQFIALLLVLWSVCADWSRKPLFLKNACIIILPLLGLTLVLGLLDEYRDYYELLPLVVALAFYTISRRLGWRVAVRSNAAEEL
ncbi:MAG: hypothetical protein NTY53_12290 [Kiritimatiellaeota bacterium]|nr:hypothetical protein [Kiritimatiellota bacterium]